MKTVPRSRRLLIVACWSALVLCFGEAAWPEASLWSPLELTDEKARAERIQPGRFLAVRLDEQKLSDLLRDVPSEGHRSPLRPEPQIRLPMPDGSWQRFRFAASPVMAPELAARYPQIRTYVGRGIDDPAATLRFDRTPHGFHAQIRSVAGTAYIDPLRDGDTAHYAVYFRRDAGGDSADFACLDDAGPATMAPDTPPATFQTTATGANLRTYRLAVAATGEFTQFHGGTVADGLAAIVTTINRVTGIYEIDAAIRLELIPQNDSIVFTDPATDPYSNLDASAMLLENESTLVSILGPSKYDIGHVFGTGDGGVAWWGVCTTFKARGVSGLASPVGDSFDVDIVAHEMGHQFKARHSWNGSSGSCGFGGWSATTAYEPGSGSTIMSYAGICGADNVVSGDADAYFHGVSVEEIADYSQNLQGSTCPVVTATGNTPPVVDAGPDRTVPRLTPFLLTAVASDADGDPLTYAWEEFDLGPQASLDAADDGSIPLFRSFPPTNDPSRSLPRLDDLLADSFSDAEKLPALGRTMTFRVTTRDNNPAGGGVAFDSLFVTVAPSAGPFSVTAPAEGEIWVDDGTVNWDVAGTNLSPVDTPLVDIVLSTDGGQTFDTLLAAATPNDGSESVDVSGIVSTSSRIRVQGHENIFFDINPGDFAILTVPQEVSPAGTTVPLRMGLDSLGTIEFESLPATDLVYHLYHADDLSTMLAGDWTSKFCDLASGSTGTWNQVDPTTVRWTPASPDDLLAGYWVVVADRFGLEGAYGAMSGGSPRPADTDASGSENNFGCP